MQDVFATETGITFELWWKPAPFSKNHSTPILTIGSDDDEETTSSALSRCDRGGYDFQLLEGSRSSSGTRLTAVFRTSDEWSEGCRTVRSEIMAPPGKLMHVVVSLSDGYQTIYVNGQQAHTPSQDPFPNDLRHWNLAQNRLHLLSYRGSAAAAPPPPPFHTSEATLTVYRLALYPGVVTESTEVVHMMLQGLPSTPPFAFDQTVLVQEDADDGTHVVEWYALPASPMDVTQALGAPQIGSIDADVRALLLESVDWDSISSNGNFSTLIADLDPVYVFLTSLPAQGRLYFAHDRSPLVMDDTPASGQVFLPLGTAPVEHKLIYLPPHNMYSTAEDIPFASLSYCIAVSPIFDPSQCISSATVNVHVLPVNDPPEALPVPMTTVPESLFETSTTTPTTTTWAKIPLLGRDVDFNDAITAVEITRPPALGSLRLAVPSFRKDLLRHGTPLESLNYIVTGEEQVYVMYVWEPSSSSSVGVVIRETVVKDSFRFRLRDKAGLWSAEETADVQIVTAVSTIANTEVTFEEDTVEELQWHGVDGSGYNRRIGFFVEKIPSPEVGLLVHPETLDPLQPGLTIDSFLNHSSGEGLAKLAFQPRENFCHSTAYDMEYDAEVRFRAVAFVNDAIVSVSDAVSQRITVACVLDVITMELPTTKLSVLETSLRRTTTDPCNGINFTAGSVMEDPETCQAAAILTGVAVTSKDLKADRAQVTVSTNSGFLTFNSIYWNRTEPLVGRQRMAASNVSLLAYPEDLTDILSRLHYQSYIAGTDYIHFDIQYGNCTELELEQSLESFKTASCQAIRQSIQVTVVRDDDKYESETRIVVGFPWQIIFCLLVYPALYIAFTYLQCSFSSDDNETVVEGSPLEPVERFIQHEDENGMFYYEDTLDGSVRWDLPPGEDFVRFEDLANAESE